jgi:hypothetical protein
MSVAGGFAVGHNRPNPIVIHCHPLEAPMAPEMPKNVAATFDAYPAPMQKKLLRLRKLILETAAKTEGVGPLEETLKWGEPSYLPSKTKSGSTIRIAWKEKTPAQYAMYFNCQTSLIDQFRDLYPDEFSYGGNRSIIFDVVDRLPEKELRHCIGLTLTYHLNKKKSARK